MRIRYIVRNIVERITRKSCDRCCHCIDGVFCDNYKRYSECTANIYPDGFEQKADWTHDSLEKGEMIIEV